MSEVGASERTSNSAPASVTVGYARMSDRGTRPGAVVLTHSDPTMPVVKVEDGVVADFVRRSDLHHTEATESLSRAVFAAVQAWETNRG